jgi:PAS domain S-box-containing protein
MSVYQKIKGPFSGKPLVKKEDYSIFVLDKDGKIENWNGAAESIFGYKLEEVVGKELDILFEKTDVDSKKLKSLLEQANFHGKFSDTCRLKRKDSKIIDASVVLNAIYDNNKLAMGFLINIRDLTNQKSTEEDAEYNNQTSDTVSNEKLKNCLDQLEALNQEFELFSYSISHDLRSPLRAIDGYIKIIDEDFTHQVDEEGKNLLGLIQKNVIKMNTLMDNLLAFSRITTRELKKEPINTRELVDELLGELNKTFPHKAKIIIKDLHPINADYSLIHLVFMHLLSNALKFSAKKDSPTIEISSEITNDQITYTINDNGVGFDMKHVNKLFGVFQRLHAPDEFEGTGMGLAIVKRILVKHNGSVWADAVPENGATFCFSVPREKE